MLAGLSASRYSAECSKARSSTLPCQGIFVGIILTALSDRKLLHGEEVQKEKEPTRGWLFIYIGVGFPAFWRDFLLSKNDVIRL